MLTVTLQPSAQSFQVDENETILAAGLRQNITLPYSCQGGSCGACAATILQGEVVYPHGEPYGLTPSEKAQGRALLCQAVARTHLVLDSPLVGRAVDSEFEAKTLPARVDKMRQLCHDVMELTLKLPASEKLRFRAGQYIDILLSGGRRRSFSIANAPQDSNYIELHVRHIPGGYFTTHVFEQMQEKALLRIEAPLGQFYRRDSNRPLLLVGGGTGIAPLKSIIDDINANGLNQRIFLYWGVRAKQDLYLDSLLTDMASQFSNLIYTPVLSQPLPDDNWSGRTGFVHEAVLADFADLSILDVYLSGPPPMIVAAKTAFLTKGLPPEQLYSDAFEYGADTLKLLVHPV